jgi:NAD+ kinase
MIMKVLLFANNTKDLASQAIQSIREWLEEREIACETISSGIFEGGTQHLDGLRTSMQNVDLICTFGGDGTILRAAHLVGASGVPMLCYNFGTLGFLTGATEDDLIPALEAAVAGTLTLDARTMLEVTVTYEDGQTDTQLAVNELVVSRGHFGRIVALDMFINDSFVDTIRGDGVLVATPTGSTAYALSAGGPIISPSNEGLCIVPISPHSLASRAVVTAKDDLVTLVPNQLNRQQLVLFVDGEVLWITSQDDPRADATSKREVARVEVRACAQRLQLLRYGDSDYYRQISKTFFRGGHA